MTIEEAQADIRDLWAALEESVKLQSHYATLLNMYDAGERRAFDNAQAWVDCLIDLGKLKRRSRREGRRIHDHR